MTGAPSSPVPAPSIDGAELGPGHDLGGSARSAVSRHPVVAGPASWGASVVVKTFREIPGSDDDPAHGYQRERIGLQHLRGTPDLLHEDAAMRTLVMEDLGGAPTLADFLTGRDPEVAWTACLRWARALGEHVVGDPDILQQVRSDLGPALERDEAIVQQFPARGLQALADWGITGTESAREEVEAAMAGLRADTGRLGVSAGDTCPDNALFVGDRVRFLDCEGVSIKPIAIDAAYALEPFSSCWCVFAPPPGLTEAMLEQFTAAASSSFPGLDRDPRWPDQVRAAIVMWIGSSGAWLLPGARTAARSIGPADALAPTSRQLLLNRWRWIVREVPERFPALADVAEQALRRGLREWSGTPELPGYPAWSM